MLDKLNAALQFQQEALNLRAQRQEILSANIANADTPGYQARDIDFASQLQKVMEAGRANGSGMSLELTNTRHIPASTSAGADLDLERTNFADNSVRYQTDLTVLGGQVKGMMSVLQG